jgi:hypothetical protein
VVVVFLVDLLVEVINLEEAVVVDVMVVVMLVENLSFSSSFFSH